jgi:hypothetical protein
MVFVSRHPPTAVSGAHSRLTAIDVPCFSRLITGKSPLTSVCEVTASLLLSAAPAVSPGRLRELGVSCVVNAASELPDTPLPHDTQVAYFKVCLEDRGDTDLLSHMDFVADMIEKVSSGTTFLSLSRSVSLTPVTSYE